MDDGDSLEAYVMNLRSKEFEILIPALALISCANSRAMELGGGFGWGENGWQLSWPDEVAQGFGLRPSQSRKYKGEIDVFKVLFEPFVTERLSIWSNLFHLTAPALVISYKASSDEPPTISPTDEEWLHWPWYVSEEKKLAALDKAIASYEELAESVDWPKLAEQSATIGPKFALFEGVAKHLAAQSGVNDTL